MVFENSGLMATGFTITILSSFVYATLTNAFLAGGSFRSKKVAVVIVLATASVLGALTPGIQDFWDNNLPNFQAIQLAGILIILTMAAVNQMVNRWRHTTKPSLVVYGFGFLLLVWPYIFK